MKQVLSTVLLSAALSIQALAQDDSIFSKGEKSTSKNFNGIVWIKRYVSLADSLDCIVALLTFEPRVRTNWHTHPGGQI